MADLLVEKEINGLRLVGCSLAGEETCIALPELNLCFDVGRAPREIISIDTVLLSHGHMDHAAGVAYYFSQRCFVGNAPGTVVAPEPLVQPLSRLMAVWAAIEGHPSEHRLVGLAPGAEHPLRRGLKVQAFAVSHGGPCLGFAVIETRHKLKPEFVGYTGPQLVEAKKQGRQIEYELEIPLVTYCGDTQAGPFLDLDVVRNARVLLLECTFFDRDHVERARAGRHMHVFDLPAVMERLRNPHIVLTHVTRRTGMGEAKKILRRVLRPEDHERTTFLMDRPRAHSRTPAPTDPPRTGEPALSRQRNPAQ